jgi:Bifunctional DNA primase/polymerase, N-terminal
MHIMRAVDTVAEIDHLAKLPLIEYKQRRKSAAEKLQIDRVNCRTKISASFVRALALIEQGIPCFPCLADKRPATPRGFKDATSDRNILDELWRRHPGALIGVPTGEISDLDILDIDPRHVAIVGSPSIVIASH